MAHAAPFEDLSRVAVHVSPCGIIAVDESGIIAFVNPAIERMFGYGALELIGQSLEVLIPHRSRPVHAGYRARFVETGEARHLGAGRELRGLHKDGREIAVEIALTPLERPEGRLTIASIIDISQRKQAEGRAREREAFYQTLLESIVDAVFVTDTEGRYLEFNAQACRLTGYTRDELLRLGVADTYVPGERGVAADRLASAAAGEPIRLERSLLRKDGSVIQVEVGAVRLPDGRLLATLHDVSERSRAEAQLRESERRFRELAEHVNEVFFVVDPASMRALYVSPAFQTVSGRDLAEAYAGPHSWDAAIHAEDRDNVLAAAQEATRTGELTAVVFRVVRPDLTIRWVRARGRAVRDGAGRIVRLVGIAEDVTDLRRTEEQFLQAQKMEAIGRLAGGIAHDFNNLLTVITSYSDLQLEDLAPGDARRADMEQILHAAREAAGLTRQLLAFSRRQVLELKVVNLNEVVAGVQKMLKRVIGEDIDLSVSLAPDLGGTRADVGQVEQVLMNLAVNARDAMPNGGMLTIETANVELGAQYTAVREPVAPGPYVLLAVSDTGVGMDEATQARIFEPFFTTKELGKGTGLGLATVYGIVKQCGGFVWVYSEPGRGAAFKIYLPKVTDPVEPLRPVVAAGDLPRGHETIVVVEDDAPVRRAVCAMLERWGYTVIPAERPSAALELAGTVTRAPDLLITDMIMPEMNGRQLAAHFDARWPGMRTLYLSGYTDEAIVRQGSLEPGASFLQKPFTPEHLARKVRETLDRRGDLPAG